MEEKTRELIEEALGMAEHPGFASRSGEPREACEEIAKVLRQVLDMYPKE